MKSNELLSGLEKSVNEMVLRTENHFGSLPDHILNRKAAPTKWSILECYEHLNRYLRYYNPAMAKRLTNAGPAITVEIKSTWVGRKSIAAMHPNNQKKQKTLKHMNPVNSDLDRMVITEFLQHQKDLLDLISKAGKVDVNKIKIPIEFFRLAKFTLAEALEFVVVHQQRHFIQLQHAAQDALHSQTVSLVV